MYFTEAYLEPKRTSTMELFCENNQQAVNYSHKIKFHRSCSTGFYIRLCFS